MQIVQKTKTSKKANANKAKGFGNTPQNTEHKTKTTIETESSESVVVGKSDSTSVGTTSKEAANDKESLGTPEAARTTESGELEDRDQTKPKSAPNKPEETEGQNKNEFIEEIKISNPQNTEEKTKTTIETESSESVVVGESDSTPLAQTSLEAANNKESLDTPEAARTTESGEQEYQRETKPKSAPNKPEETESQNRNELSEEISSSAKNTYLQKIQLRKNSEKALLEAQRKDYYFLGALALEEANNRHALSGKKAEIDLQIEKNASQYISNPRENNFIIKFSARIYSWQNAGEWDEKDLETWLDGTLLWGYPQRIEALALPTKNLTFGAIAHFKKEGIVPTTTQIKEYRESADRNILLEDGITDEAAKNLIVEKAKDSTFTRETLDKMINEALALKEEEQKHLLNFETKNLLIEYGYKPIRGFIRKSEAQKRAERKDITPKLNKWAKSDHFKVQLTQLLSELGIQAMKAENAAAA